MGSAQRRGVISQTLWLREKLIFSKRGERRRGQVSFQTIKHRICLPDQAAAERRPLQQVRARRLRLALLLREVRAAALHDRTVKSYGPGGGGKSNLTSITAAAKDETVETCFERDE